MELLADDALETIAMQLLQIRMLGEIALVMFGRTCRRHKEIATALCQRPHIRWSNGFKKVFTWHIDVRNAPKRVYSPVFSCRHGHQWRLLLFFKGNKTKGEGPSLYLEVANSVFLPHCFVREANFMFQLTAVNGPDLVTDQTKHRFTDACPDWGYRTMTGQISEDDFAAKYLQNSRLEILVEVHCKPHKPHLPLKPALSQQAEDMIASTVMRYLQRHSERSEVRCACEVGFAVISVWGKIACQKAACDISMEDMHRRLWRLLQPSVSLVDPDHGVDAWCEQALWKPPWEIWRSTDRWLLLT